MPAPKTSTLRMPTVDSSHATLTASSTLVDTIAARRSAMADDRQRHQPQHRAAVGDDQQDAPRPRRSRRAGGCRRRRRPGRCRPGCPRVRSPGPRRRRARPRAAGRAASSTWSMLSVPRSRTTGNGDDRRGLVLGHHDGGLLPLAATGRSALRPARLAGRAVRGAPAGAPCPSACSPDCDSRAVPCWVSSSCVAWSSSPDSAVHSTMATWPSSSGSCSSSSTARVLSAPTGSVSRAEASRSPSGTNAITNEREEDRHEREEPGQPASGDRPSGRGGVVGRHEVSSGSEIAREGDC